jgi:hypothetical protein
MNDRDRDSLSSIFTGFRVLALTLYCLAMALPAQDSIRTTYGIEAFLFSLAAAISFSQSNEVRILFWGGYLNICVICLVGVWIWRSSKPRVFEAITVAVLIVSIICVTCLAERRPAIGFYLWLFSSILLAFSTLLELWSSYVQERTMSASDLDK